MRRYPGPRGVRRRTDKTDGRTKVAADLAGLVAGAAGHFRPAEGRSFGHPSAQVRARQGSRRGQPRARLVGRPDALGVEGETHTHRPRSPDRPGVRRDRLVARGGGPGRGIVDPQGRASGGPAGRDGSRDDRPAPRPGPYQRESGFRLPDRRPPARGRGRAVRARRPSVSLGRDEGPEAVVRRAWECPAQDPRPGRGRREGGRRRDGEGVDARGRHRPGPEAGESARAARLPEENRPGRRQGSQEGIRPGRWEGGQAAGVACRPRGARDRHPGAQQAPVELEPRHPRRPGGRARRPPGREGAGRVGVPAQVSHSRTHLYRHPGVPEPGPRRLADPGIDRTGR